MQKFYFPEIAKPSLPKRQSTIDIHTVITIKHDLSTAAAPGDKSCPKITQRNKRALRVLTNFSKDHEILV